MSVLLTFENLEKSYGPRRLFTGISLGLSDEVHTGLIGPNGSGKSTLLKILAGIETPDAGTITLRRGLRMGYVAQEHRYDPAATVEQLLAGAIDDDHVDDHERPTRAAMMAGRLGFADPSQAAGTLSGGWVKRLAIGCQLIRDPDLLLLDEPTNHLDLEGVLWLEKLLNSARFACLIVSHDRSFLENTTGRTIELSGAYAQGFLSIDGPYSEFLIKREEHLAAQASRQLALASTVRREIEWLSRKAKARTTKAKGRIQSADRMMAELADLKTRNTSHGAAAVDFVGSERRTRKLLEMKGASKSLGGKALFSGVDLVLSPGTRLGLLGPNGSGKTTLLRLITGELEPDAGTIRRADGLRIVRFDQNRRQLDQVQTLRQALVQDGDTITHRDGSMHVTAWAKRFLFRVEQLDMPVGDLSGGEQARVLIAQLMLQPADVLILDEPTNDLDIPTLDVLEQSLEEFPGALVLVTHDRYLLERLSTELLALDGAGGAAPYADASQWERAREQAEAPASASKAPPAPAASKPAAKKLNWNEQRELEQMEAKLLDAESLVESLQQVVSDPAVAADHVKMHEACARLHDAQQRVEQLYARWSELEAKQSMART
jgi:ATP-binding cassette subfamily F protein uup